ncbi:MAG TPA: DoxX family membrane protein [Tepidisphaeraceae bacterium]|jgi:uncharacterized membrane protein|nr:DoxX family membrane protein [Tepidisphaeraceae bacterium]
MIDAKRILRWTAAVVFIAAGANHFIVPGFYRKIVPPGFPRPRVLVAVSGVCEILGGGGLLLTPLRKIAGWGLIALLIAVFPANIHMAVSPEKIPDMKFPHWALWARLPMQFVLIAWVWFAAFAGPKTKIHEGRD